MTGVLRTIWSRWLALCEKIGDLVTLCVLTVFYFVLFLIPSLYFTLIPLDLTSFMSSVVEFGFDPFMYAKLEPRLILYTVAINFVIVLLVTIPPAVRAARTKPMQSLRLQ